MPITLLHFGVMAPIRHFFPGKVSLWSFALVNLAMDANAIMYYVFGLPTPELHGASHTLLGAMETAVIVSILGFHSRKWILGAFIAGISHILLDMLVHPEMQPFYPLQGGNPYYLSAMGPVSLALLPLTVWLIVQIVSGSLGWLRKRREGQPQEHSSPSA